jgi:hypothetical protein
VAGGGWARRRTAGGGVSVVGEVVGGGGEGFILDLGKRGTEVGLEGVCMAKRGKWGKNDLKNCSRWPKTEYVQTYMSTFDRTRVGAWYVRTYISKFERTRAVQCVCEGRCSRTHHGEVVRTA